MMRELPARPEAPKPLSTFAVILTPFPIVYSDSPISFFVQLDTGDFFDFVTGLFVLR